MEQIPVVKNKQTKTQRKSNRKNHLLPLKMCFISISVAYRTAKWPAQQFLLPQELSTERAAILTQCETPSRGPQNNGVCSRCLPSPTQPGGLFQKPPTQMNTYSLGRWGCRRAGRAWHVVQSPAHSWACFENSGSSVCVCTVFQSEKMQYFLRKGFKFDNWRAASCGIERFERCSPACNRGAECGHVKVNETAKYFSTAVGWLSDSFAFWL